jgi:hypothetical protein
MPSANANSALVSDNDAAELPAELLNLSDRDHQIPKTIGDAGWIWKACLGRTIVDGANRVDLVGGDLVIRRQVLARPGTNVAGPTSYRWLLDGAQIRR